MFVNVVRTVKGLCLGENVGLLLVLLRQRKISRGGQATATETSCHQSTVHPGDTALTGWGLHPPPTEKYTQTCILDKQL